MVSLLAMGQFPALRLLEPLLPFFFAALIGCLVLSNVKLATFTCPQCHKRFNAGVFSGGFSLRENLGRACNNCGLRLYGGG